MVTIDSRFVEQINRAEQRWNASSVRRETAHVEIRKVNAGEKPDWKALDQTTRYVRRLERLGLRDAVSGLVDESQPDLNPLERILGASQLAGVDFFEWGLIAARAVARIKVRDTTGRLESYGTGVMVSPRLMLTNNHVLTSATAAAGSIAQFEYLTTASGAAREPRSFRLDPTVFFRTNAALDFTLVAVEAQNSAGDQLATRGWCPLIPGSGKAVVGERVNIIQHPGGERMQVAIRDNTLVAVVDDFLQYEADTRPGSSGSPVFNEQWEMAALHHAGVPERNKDGRIKLRDGSVWNGSRRDEDKIAWKANEGVRISRIVAHVDALALSGTERNMWQQAFNPPAPQNLWALFDHSCTTAAGGGQIGGGAPEGAAGPEFGPDGAASWLFRLSFGPVGPPPASVTHAPSAHPAPITLPLPSPTVLAAGPTAHVLADQIMERFGQDGPYYDAAEDEVARLAYWADVDLSASSGPLQAALTDKLEATHGPRHGYARARHEFLYPAIDLHPDGDLKSIYSGAGMDPRETIARELAQVLPRATAMGFEAASLSLDQLLAADALWDQVEEETFVLETAIAFNCEHVVPQSWFDKAQPMKADIHHLFSCEPGCNSFRSNIPYWIFAPEDEVERDFCGRREGNKFEPEAGFGAIARATMYFLMRYPGLTGDIRSEMTKSRAKVLMTWHEAYEPDAYELHRNWLTEKAQGNRNPFIDHPEIATVALLERGFG